MLIKDPYLGSQIKPRSYSTIQGKNIGELNQKQNRPKQQYLTQQYGISQGKVGGSGIQSYERQMRSLSEAYRSQQEALRKVTGLHYVNKQYNEAMKLRNYELNTKLNDLGYQKSLLAKRHQEQLLKNTYDKDFILTKYQDQNNEIISLKRANSELIQQKIKLQEEIEHLVFLIQKDSQQGSLEIKEQLIRMENMERTLRGIIDTKDAQIVQLRHRMKLYEDENRRLGDLNKTLTITRQQLTKQQDKLDNLSNISHMDSNMKSHNKENMDMLNRRDDMLNRRDDKMSIRDDYLIFQLNQQKEMNKQLLSEITLMKKKLFEEPEEAVVADPRMFEEKRQVKNSNSIGNMRQVEERKQGMKSMSVQEKLDRHNEIREKVNQKVYELYCRSIKQAQKQKKNSLLIFIQNYKKSTIHQSLPQINEYMTLREELKSSYKTQTSQQIKQKIELQLPMKLNSRQHSQDSQWVLSTMQFTKNLKQSAQTKNPGQQSNNVILFLFRLLTIEYRTKNPLQNKKFLLDGDVENQLLHSVVKATQTLLQIN